jgi:hypothetical protein
LQYSKIREELRKNRKLLQDKKFDYIIKHMRYQKGVKVDALTVKNVRKDIKAEDELKVWDEKKNGTDYQSALYKKKMPEIRN